MTKLYTLLCAAMLCMFTHALAQPCASSATSYDLTVVSYTVVPPMANPSYLQGYICPGATLMDSAICCTRFVNVDSGATLIVGPNSYGMAYVKSTGTFNGQNVSNNWTVYAESGATVINHTGNNIACPQITFQGGSCSTGFNTVQAAKPSVALNGAALNFAFPSSVNVQIELFDASGRVVRTATVLNSSICSMDVADLAGGIYMYRVMQNGEVTVSDKVCLVQ